MELRERNPKDYWTFPETFKFFAGEPDRARLAAILENIASQENLLGDGRSCIVSGRGGQTRSVYKHLSSLSGIELMWDGSGLPLWAYPFSWIAASHMGLIRIDDRRQLVEVFDILSNRALVELHSFSTELLSGICNHVRRKKWRSKIGPIVGTDPTHFSFGADGDNFDSNTGIFAWCSFGRECPIRLPTDAVSNT